MQIGVIGLGRMGGNIVRRLARAGHSCVVYDANPAPGEALAKEAGAHAAASVPALVEALGASPRTVWVMLPSGKITEETIAQLATLMRADDIIIDGGNTNFKDDVRRGRELRAKGIEYLDVGTSGGVWGLERGYCLMIGGEAEVVRHLDPIFSALAPGLGTIERTSGREGADPRAEQGYIHAGPVGAGHFVKMIHNGIEYGMMQAFAEGFDIMRNRSSEKLPADERFDLNLGDIAEVWRRGSVVTSWLLDLTASALATDEHLEHFSGHVDDSGEGRWTIEAAIEEAVPADVLAASLFVRFRSRQDHTFAEKILSAMRLGFGGHVEAPKG
jgi:6-phosphogluconate dehydrogenase